MASLRFIFPDQLSESLTSLQDVADDDVVLFCETMDEASYVAHHKKKLAFLYAAQRHFAEQLTTKGLNVLYVKLDDPSNSGSWVEEIKRAFYSSKYQQIICTEPSEYRLLAALKEQKKTLPIIILNDLRFLASHSDFDNWAAGKKQYRMEFFYREMRKKYSILLDSKNKPEGGSWNYDKENRKPPKIGMFIPSRISHKKSDILKEVIALVAEKFPNNFGNLEPFHYAITRQQALIELDDFIENILPYFGDFQDAMVSGQPYLYHSLLSSYINAGLLLPLEICQKAEAAYHAKKASLNSVEGFIRQILGWREFIRGIYWHQMPKYATLNFLNATTPLPDFYWGSKTHMFCMAETVRHTQDHAYSHHIQRLMITGNFALLAGLDVKEVQEWYLAVYSDAFEWVEMPNTLGMALFGDYGIVASKPYAASGKYINKMSNYCSKCKYDPEVMTGENACPFNALYWDFIARHENEFRGNQRMPFVFSTWDRFAEEKQVEIRKQAKITLEKMNEGQL